MNFLQPSKFLTPASGILGLISAAMVLGIFSCKDEFDPPIQGTIQLRMASDVAGTIDGGQILINDEVVEASVSLSQYSFVVDAGPARIRFIKECALVSPSDEIDVAIVAGETTTVDMHVGIQAGVTVQAAEATMSGAEILVNGEPTGLVTPATFCLVPGEYSIDVRLFGAAPVEPISITVTSDATETVEFALEPSGQAQGALVEVLTATECPNCLPVDVAAERLWEDPEFVEAGIISVQVHHPWSGNSDPFANALTVSRFAFYGEDDGLPLRVTNGTVKTRGALNGDEDVIERQILSIVAPYVAGTPAKFALYWLDSDREPSVSVTGRLRIVALEDIENAADIRVMGASYKNNLFYPVAIHGGTVEPFFRVIRTIRDKGSLADFGVQSRGDWVDIEFDFDISNDIDERDNSLWSEDEMGLIGFVQDSASGEIYQVRHTFLP